MAKKHNISGVVKETIWSFSRQQDACAADNGGESGGNAVVGGKGEKASLSLVRSLALSPFFPARAPLVD